jgi:hypothetical protein
MYSRSIWHPWSVVTLSVSSLYPPFPLEKIGGLFAVLTLQRWDCNSRVVAVSCRSTTIVGLALEISVNHNVFRSSQLSNTIVHPLLCAVDRTSPIILSIAFRIRDGVKMSPLVLSSRERKIEKSTCPQPEHKSKTDCLHCLHCNQSNQESPFHRLRC